MLVRVSRAMRRAYHTLAYLGLVTQQNLPVKSAVQMLSSRCFAIRLWHDFGNIGLHNVCDFLAYQACLTEFSQNCVKSTFWPTFPQLSRLRRTTSVLQNLVHVPRTLLHPRTLDSRRCDTGRSTDFKRQFSAVLTMEKLGATPTLVAVCGT